jgi:hypothetical protein
MIIIYYFNMDNMNYNLQIPQNIIKMLYDKYRIFNLGQAIEERSG